DVGYLHPPEERVANAIQGLPPDVKQLIEKPGPTAERINHALSWASRPDESVLHEHQARDHKIIQFADIRNAPLKQMDHVAEHFAAQYRHRALLTGALTALPGGLWALVATGLDVQLTAVYAVRMAAKVAQSYGYDTSLMDEQAHLADVLALVAGVDSLRGIGNWLTREGLTSLLPRILPRILTRLSLDLTEEQAARWIGRIIPGVAAIVGGTVDYTFLRVAGERAIAYYHNRFIDEHGLLGSGVKKHAIPGVKDVPALPPGPAATAAAASAATTNAASDAVESTTGASAAPSATPAPVTHPYAVAPAPLPQKHRRSPERPAVYTAIFSIIAFLITVAALVALGVLIYQGFFHQ
ncbi:MAG TPA: EcsC family protein, partial [Ktedonobacterales bacterium]|nr:EcsC family protein [Ktedonobacterales bacterium]